MERLRNFPPHVRFGYTRSGRQRHLPLWAVSAIVRSFFGSSGSGDSPFPRTPCPTQDLGEVLYPLKRHTGDVRLRKRLFHQACSSSIPLDDGRLQRSGHVISVSSRSFHPPSFPVAFHNAPHRYPGMYRSARICPPPRVARPLFRGSCSTSLLQSRGPSHVDLDWPIFLSARNLSCYLILSYQSLPPEFPVVAVMISKHRNEDFSVKSKGQNSCYVIPGTQLF
jgi:hypothetical protein